MNYISLQREIERTPFQPLRIHLVSGKTVDLRYSGQGWMLEFELLLLQESRDRKREGLFDLISPLNVERIEQLQS